MTIESVNDGVLQEDLEYIAKQDIPFEMLKGASVLVTGGTGLVGSMTVKALACCNRIHNLGMTILPMIRSEEKAKSVYGDMLGREDISLVKGDILDHISIDHDVDYIIHGASVTASKTFVTKPVETIDTAYVGTKNLLDLADEKKVK